MQSTGHIDVHTCNTHTHTRARIHTLLSCLSYLILPVFVILNNVHLMVFPFQCNLLSVAFGSLRENYCFIKQIWINFGFFFSPVSKKALLDEAGINIHSLLFSPHYQYRYVCVDACHSGCLPFYLFCNRILSWNDDEWFQIFALFTGLCFCCRFVSLSVQLWHAASWFLQLEITDIILHLKCLSSVPTVE